jgi:FAD dependent oxidoreductase
VDVLVVGGGPGGLSAAIAASRAGVRTMLIERYGCFGGNMTVAGVETLAWYRHEKTIDTEGIGIEFERRAMAMGATTPEVQSDSQALNTELFKHVADTLVLESGVMPVLHCFGVAPILEGDTIRGVVTESKSGRQAIGARVVIDASGDADIAFRAGAPCVESPPSERQALTLVFSCSGVDRQRFMAHVAEDPPTYADWGGSWCQQSHAGTDAMFSPYLEKQFRRAIRENIIEKSDWDLCGTWSTITPEGEATGLNLVHRLNLDGTDIRDLTRAEMEGRTQVLRAIRAMNHAIPGFENARLRNFAMTVGVRDSRKICGEYDLSGQDVLEEGRFDDAIGIFPEFVDGYGILRLPVTGRYFQVPYRSLIPKGIDNLLVAGRAIAGDNIAHAATRNMMCCAVSGQGAGVAAAVAAKGKTTCRHTPVAAIQRELSRQNVRYRY